MAQKHSSRHINSFVNEIKHFFFIFGEFFYLCNYNK